MLREYQQRSIDMLYAWFEAGGRGNPCLVLPTGSGKSHIVAALCKDAIQNWPETRVLMLTHVKELIEQNAEKMRQHWPGAPLGIYSASIGKKELGEPITFAGIQSVRSKAQLLGHIDLVIIDECFVAGTKISTTKGHVDIDKVQCGDMVYNQCGIGEVTSISCRSTTETYLLEFDDGSKTECTGNHKFFTSSGWKAARELEVGEDTYSIEDMRFLWERVSSLDQNGRRKDRVCNARGSLDKATMLLSVVFKETEKSDEQSSDSIKGKGKTKRDQAQTYQSWRKRAIASLGATSVASCAWRGMGGGVTDKNESRPSKRDIPECLQSGYCQSGNDDCDRDRRTVSQFNRKTGTRQKENEVFGSVRVARVSRIKHESPVLVFNLQVSGHPSYFAGGVAVHNCHLVNHKDEGGYRKLLAELNNINPALRVVGLTATPYRLGHGLITDKPALFDALIEPVSIEELIVKDYLAPLRSKVTRSKLDTSGVHKRGGEFIESELQAAVDTDENNQRVVREVIELAGERKAWLFFCAGVKHSNHIAEVLRQHGIAAECVTGETPKKERERLLEEFKAGRIRALTNANVLTTGFDYPDIDLIAMLRPTMSASLYVQMAGRGMRIKSHTDHCLVLDFAGVVATHGPITAVQPGQKAHEGNGQAPVKVCDNCGELCSIAARVCSACGNAFPEPEKKKLELRQDDIMGLSGSEMQVTSWSWRKHISRASGKEMIALTYYGSLSDPAITEYFPILHEGYAGQKAVQKIVEIARRTNVAPGAFASNSIQTIVINMNRSNPPKSIEFQRDGKFFRVMRRRWA